MPPPPNWNNRGRRPPGPSTPGRGASQPAGQDRRGDDDELERLLQAPTAPFQYFTSNDPRTPRPAIFDDVAREVGQKLAGLPASQLRRFYAETMALKRQLEIDSSLSADAIRARMQLLKARAAYTWARQRKYPKELVCFFTRHAEAVHSRDDFLRGFQPHFEAVIAYHKVFERKREQEPD